MLNSNIIARLWIWICILYYIFARAPQCVFKLLYELQGKQYTHTQNGNFPFLSQSVKHFAMNSFPFRFFFSPLSVSRFLIFFSLLFSRGKLDISNIWCPIAANVFFSILLLPLPLRSTEQKDERKTEPFCHVVCHPSIQFILLPLRILLSI